MSWKWTCYLIIGSTFLPVIFSVDRSNFKTCQEARFCRKHRELKSDEYIHELLTDTAVVAPGGSVFSATVINNKTGDDLILEISPLKDRSVRIKINEKMPVRKRYELDMSLNGIPQLGTLEMKKEHGQIQLMMPQVMADGLSLTLTPRPFRIDVYEHGVLLITLNAANLLLIDPMKIKPSFIPESHDDDPAHDDADKPEEEQADEENQVKDAELSETVGKQEEPWEETFKSHHDSKPHGGNSIGLDVSFIGFENLYGLPEHADSLRLRATKAEGDPYRLYNLDVFEYEVDSVMALYGAIPFIMAHNEKNTVGMYWNNAAETWIDIDYNTASHGGSTIFGSASVSKADAHWISESGIVDVFLFLGPKPADVSRQFTSIVGRPFLPPFATLGYHQSRWNYNDERDVHQVHEKFDEYDIPVDVMWLDIEYTDGKRYFTWDAAKFPHPVEMLKNLTSKGRNLVIISDPHIKKDDNYFLDKEMKEKDFYVKDKNGNLFEGWCWPGAAHYPDFLNPGVREYYGSLYSRETFNEMWTWNDMNEPSVFNGPEITMHKDILHYGDLEHREIHNIYGMAHLLGTFDGHLKRSNYKLRPFILTRAFFAGTQRIAAAWTGDNAAEWSHLRISNPMLLSLSLSGMTFVGADVGGFFKNPDEQLLIRWYQHAAFQPFFRAHAHIDTKRREPWLFSEQTMMIIRDSIRARYTFLPFWYTLFFQANQTGNPMMRPLWYEFPTDTSTFAMDSSFMIGDALLVQPVMEENGKSVDVYFPGNKTDVWYDVTSLESYHGGQRKSIDAPIHKVPLFQRSGTIIPRRFRVRRSAILSIEDPITLSIAADELGDAHGHLYLDDGVSLDHIKKDYVYMKFDLHEGILKSRIYGDKMNRPKKYKTKVWLERVFITGWRFRPSGIELNDMSSGQKTLLEFYYDDKHRILTVRKPGILMDKEWAMVIRP